ncbi:exonuclease domain-containing protein [Actinokineospora enzanensis]|uniref:exonuclease domain-containing protein n=1 Tax=Actinokineospora enzanensis TaxID=155975 RepID=UPI00035CF733|nr:exonuclease domain-containing protein [Actinokineospora enzanensis]
MAITTSQFPPAPGATGGYAVVDTETTGISAGLKHRIAEIAIVHVDAQGVVTDEWCTLVNPDRDLGPQAIHGIHAADTRRAPRFAQIVGDVIDRLRGRIVVAHNWPFDAMHLRAEFERLGTQTPLHAHAGLCTMRAAGMAQLAAGRSLVDCCTAIGLPPRSWHSAHDDALAAAGLLGYLIERHPETVRIVPDHLETANWPWPSSWPGGLVKPVRRTQAEHTEQHFLARLVERLPRDEEPEVDTYFAMLDNALLDRRISATEADALLELAHDLGMHKADVLNVHHTYLRQLAKAAWQDRILTDEERTDITTVAILLGFDATYAEQVLAEEAHPDDSTRPVTIGGLRLRAGDKAVLTGDMIRPRDSIVHQATAAGLRITTHVSKQTHVVAAADPDSLSGKAKRARELGVPVVDQHTFLRALDTIS